jgi:hypothetical protein
MSLAHPLREQRIQGQIEELSGQIGLSLVEECANPQAGPFVRRIGENPRGIERDEYIKRVGARVVERFSGTDLDGVVSFKEKASVEASGNLVVKKSGHSELATKEPGLVLIFDQPPMLR